MDWSSERPRNVKPRYQNDGFFAGGGGAITSISSGTGVTVTPNPLTTGAGTVGLSNTGVGAGTYGDATNVAQVTLNAQGQVTAASAVPIAFPAAGITVEDEGVPLATAASTINFVGGGVTATGAGATKTVTIPDSNLVIQDEGVPLATAASTINFVGNGVAATGAGATKTVTITGGFTPSYTLERTMFGGTPVNSGNPFTFPTAVSSTGGLAASWDNAGTFTCPATGEWFVEGTYVTSGQQTAMYIDVLGTTGWGSVTVNRVVWRRGEVVPADSRLGLVSGSIYLRTGDKLYFYKGDAFQFNGGADGGVSSRLIIRSRF